MALTNFQRSICRLIAAQRKEDGVSYVAGGVALNVFHDAQAAVHTSFAQDRKLLKSRGYNVSIKRELPGFVEAVVARAGQEVRMEWARDSAFRFFPLMAHEELGLTLHPFDLATNKVLALVGRLEVRDWVDVISCHDSLQPLGYLLWAACGKDPGFSPESLLSHAARTTHYAEAEVAQLVFHGPRPDAGELARRWRHILEEAAEIIGLIPPEQAGSCVLDRSSRLFTGDRTDLEQALLNQGIQFHGGSLGGAFPRVLD